MGSRGVEAISGWCSVDMVKTPEIASLVALNIEERSRTEYILSLQSECAVILHRMNILL
jgi:hypothetical protein